MVPRTLWVLAVLAVVAPRAVQADIIVPPGPGTYPISFRAPIGETFIADSPWATVGLYVWDGNDSLGPSDYSIQIDLWEGAGTSGRHLASTTFDLTDNYVDYADVDYSWMRFTVGQTYTVTLTNDTPRWTIGMAGTRYPDGSPVYDGVAYLGPEYQDFAIRVLATEAPVPEPSTGLLALGFVPVALLAIYRRHGSAKSPQKF